LGGDKIEEDSLTERRRSDCRRCCSDIEWKPKPGTNSADSVLRCARLRLSSQPNPCGFSPLRLSRPTVMLSGGRRGSLAGGQSCENRGASSRAAQAARPLELVLGADRIDRRHHSRAARLHRKSRLLSMLLLALEPSRRTHFSSEFLSSFLEP
jgi:hypothetical protein